MCVLITRTGLYREYVWKDRNLPYRVNVALPVKGGRLDVTDEQPSQVSTPKIAEFYKIGLTDSYGRPIYVQRW